MSSVVVLRNCIKRDGDAEGCSTEGNHFEVLRGTDSQIIRDCEEKFRIAVENLMECFGLYRAVRNSDGKIIDFIVEYVNEAACIYNNLSREEQVGQNLFEVFPDDGTKLFDEFCQVVTTGLPLVKQTLIYGDNLNQELTKAYDMRISKLNDGVVVSWRNIIDKIVLTEKLQSLEGRFSTAFDAAPNAMAITTVSGIFVNVNKGFEELTGYTRELILGENVSNLNLWMNFDNRESLISTLLEKGSCRNIEVKIRNKDNEIKETLASLLVLRCGDKNHILTIIDDVTSRKTMEMEISRLERLNLVGQMAAGIGHEIRNPMTTVRGFLQMIGNKETDIKKKEYYDLMIDELDRANVIISEFLSLAKDRLVRKEPASLNGIINSVYPILSVDAIRQDKRIILKKGDIPKIMVSDKEIRQLIMNLVFNGLEAMTAGGLLTLGTYMEKGKVILYVQDEGRGIDGAIINKLGNPFLTTKDNGTGLGLAVCYSIAAKHNATIEVKTNPSGTTFFVIFDNRRQQNN